VAKSAPLAPGAAPVPSSPAPAAAAQAATAARSGEQVFQQACVACHGTGLAGAPKLGDSGAWKPRLAQGKPTLYQHALHGIRAMPAKGGNPSLPDAEVKAAVDYMLSQSK
jgi:cytochrome c5